MTIDIDATRVRLLAIPGCSVVDIALVLLDEIERLREEAHELRLMVEEAARAENANAEDAKRERAAVVAWLRDDLNEAIDPVRGLLAAVADCIERGEHRREEKQEEEEEEHDPSDDWRFCEGCGCRKQTARARSWSDHSWCDDCTSRE